MLGFAGETTTRTASQRDTITLRGNHVVPEYVVVCADFGEQI